MPAAPLSPARHSRPVRFFCALGRSVLVTSFLLFCAAVLCYLGRWDFVAAFTFLPFWWWGIVGLSLALAGWFFERAHRTFFLLCFMWVAATLTLSDDISRLLLSRLESHQFSHKNKVAVRVRVLTLNCAGRAAAAMEVLSEKPDLVLLQESPPEDAVAVLARKLFGDEGHYLYGLDCSIIAHGQIEALPVPKGNHFARAKIRFADGEEIEAVSVRLNPPEIRFDLWSPSCWAAHQADRLSRREQLAELFAQPGWSEYSHARIMGGDFNLPGRDGVFRLLEPNMKDAFREAGIGWGNSAINDLPVSRPDQIWISKTYRAEVTKTKRSGFSDHRMVVSDVALK